MRRLFDALAEAHWLGTDRARGYRTILLAVTAIALVGWVATSRHGIDRAGAPLGTDFLAFWSAARLTLAGHAGDAYDLARIYAMERSSVAIDPGPSSFLYPPPFLLVCLPFGAMPYLAALAAWLAATGTAWLLMIRRWLGGGRDATLTSLAFPAVAIEIGNGQNGFLTSALLGGGLLLVGRRPWLAGALLGALVVKPQLALAVPVLVLAAGLWRVAAAGIASAALLCLASLAAFGPAAWTAFSHGSALGRAILEHGLVEPGKMASAYAAIRVLGGSASAGYAVQAGVAIGVAAMLAIVCRRRDVPLLAKATMTASASVLMSPFLLDYDLVAIAVPLAWLWREGLRRSFLRWEKAVLGGAFLLPLVARTLALGLGLPIAPLVLLALFGAVARAAFRSSPSRH